MQGDVAAAARLHPSCVAPVIVKHHAVTDALRLSEKDVPMANVAWVALLAQHRVPEARLLKDKIQALEKPFHPSNGEYMREALRSRDDRVIAGLRAVGVEWKQLKGYCYHFDRKMFAQVVLAYGLPTTACDDVYRW